MKNVSVPKLLSAFAVFLMLISFPVSAITYGSGEYGTGSFGSEDAPAPPSPPGSGSPGGSISLPASNATRNASVPAAGNFSVIITVYPVRMVYVELSAAKANASAKVARVDDASLTSGLLGKILYYSFEVSRENFQESEIKKAQIHFSVDKEWMISRNVEARSISLARLSEGKWQMLETNIEGENATHVSYYAATNGLGTFAIAAEGRRAENPPIPGNWSAASSGSPEGLGTDAYLVILFPAAVLALIIAYFFLRKIKGRNKKDDSHSDDNPPERVNGSDPHYPAPVI